MGKWRELCFGLRLAKQATSDKVDFAQQTACGMTVCFDFAQHAEGERKAKKATKVKGNRD
jgi:hypothetical protein